ncbi:MAG: NF038122 family metalloprotease [Pirellulales bacterium]|nr:NF038122 family metalloprotease [Pirellulales bacterium]
MMRWNSSRAKTHRVHAEMLERRELLAAAPVPTHVVPFPAYGNPGVLTAGQEQRTYLYANGTSLTEIVPGSAEAQSLAAMQAALPEPGDPGGNSPFEIVILPSDALTQPQNRAWWVNYEKAADVWEQFFDDPVTIFIDADIGGLPPGVLGVTSSVPLLSDYGTMRQALINDAEPDDAIVNSLPLSNEASAIVPIGFNLTGAVAGNKANLKALGFRGLDEAFGPSDGKITLSTDAAIAWDFDDTNGINGYSVLSVMLHEIGHLLGFVSDVDVVDNAIFNFTTSPVAPTLLDLFRFENDVPGHDPTSAADFRNFPRFLASGGEAVTDTIEDEWRMSTGSKTGDGGQASHWKDEFFTGTQVGIMDPTGEFNVETLVERSDRRIFDLMGYDTLWPGELSDLLGASFAAVGTTTASGGDTVPIQYRVRNAGEIAAPYFRVQFVLSNNQSYEPLFDAIVGEYTVDGLGGLTQSSLRTASVVLPGPTNIAYFGNITPRTMYLLMITDAYDEAYEQSEINNLGVSIGIDKVPLFVDPLGLGIDLTGASLLATPDAGTPGTPIQVNYQIANNGNVDVNAPFDVHFYLSTNTGLDPSDYFLGSQHFDGLTRNTVTPTATKNFVLPAAENPIYGAGNGTYFITMFTDFGDDIPEANETNNFSVGQGTDYDTIQITILPPGPDLKGRMFDVVPSDVSAGTAVPIHFKVENTGNVNAGPFRVNFYLSHDNQITTTDYFIGQYLFTGLTQSTLSPLLTQIVTLPQVDSAFWNGTGTYTIGMIVDADIQVSEVNETDNANLGQTIDLETLNITLNAPPANLRGTHFNLLPAQVSVGTPFNAEFTVENNGSTAAPSFEVRFYLSRDEAITTGDTLLFTRIIPGLAIGANTGNLLQTLDLPLGTQTGPAYIGMIVDPLGAIAETNEGDNANRGSLLDREVTEIVPPDPATVNLPQLRGTSFDVVPAEVTAGNSFDIQYRVENQGAAAAGAFEVRFYASSDEDISTADVLLGTQAFASLGAFANTGILAKQLTLPAQTPLGPLFIGMIIDPAGVIGESNEEDNRNRGPGLDSDNLVVVTPPPPPVLLSDLKGAGFNVVQTTAAPGTKVDIQYTVVNASAVAGAGNFVVRFYVSNNPILGAGGTDTLLGEQAINGLPISGSTGILTKSLTLPGNFSAVPAYICMLIDATDAVLESNEVNNRNQGVGFDSDTLLIDGPPIAQVAANVWVGAFAPASAQFAVGFPGNPGAPNMNWTMGIPGWLSISGDWNGDGIDTVGLYNPATAQFFLSNALGNSIADVTPFTYGMPGWIPLAGDWNNDGIDTVGLYNPATAQFFLRNANTTGTADIAPFNYGLPNWRPVVGDWNGDGIDTIGLYQPSSASFFLRNTNSTGVADVTPFNYGMASWLPVSGDWNSDESDSVGVYNPVTGQLFLRNSNTTGVADVAPLVVGSGNGLPLAGKYTAGSGLNATTLLNSAASQPSVPSALPLAMITSSSMQMPASTLADPMPAVDPPADSDALDLAETRTARPVDYAREVDKLMSGLDEL